MEQIPAHSVLQVKSDYVLTEANLIQEIPDEKKHVETRIKDHSF